MDLQRPTHGSDNDKSSGSTAISSTSTGDEQGPQASGSSEKQSSKRNSVKERLREIRELVVKLGFDEARHAERSKLGTQDVLDSVVTLLKEVQLSALPCDMPCCSADLDGPKELSSISVLIDASSRIITEVTGSVYNLDLKNAIGRPIEEVVDAKDHDHLRLVLQKDLRRKRHLSFLRIRCGQQPPVPCSVTCDNHDILKRLVLTPLVCDESAGRFFTRHSSTCRLHSLSVGAFFQLGYLPHDVVGQSFLHLVHPNDLQTIFDAHSSNARFYPEGACVTGMGEVPPGTAYHHLAAPAESHAPHHLTQFSKIVKSRWKPHKAKPWRCRTAEGGWVTMETEWSCFVNPWSRQIEFIIGLHYVSANQTFENGDKLNPKNMEVYNCYERQISAFLAQKLPSCSPSPKSGDSPLPKSTSHEHSPNSDITSESPSEKNFSILYENLIEDFVAKKPFPPATTLHPPLAHLPASYHHLLAPILPTSEGLLTEARPHDLSLRSKNVPDPPPPRPEPQPPADSRGHSGSSPESYTGAYVQLMRNENIKRFFESQPKTHSSDESMGERSLTIGHMSDLDRHPSAGFGGVPLTTELLRQHTMQLERAHFMSWKRRRSNISLESPPLSPSKALRRDALSRPSSLPVLKDRMAVGSPSSSTFPVPPWPTPVHVVPAPVHSLLGPHDGVPRGLQSAPLDLAQNSSSKALAAIAAKRNALSYPPLHGVTPREPIGGRERDQVHPYWPRRSEAGIARPRPVYRTAVSQPIQTPVSQPVESANRSFGIRVEHDKVLPQTEPISADVQLAPLYHTDPSAEADRDNNNYSSAVKGVTEALMVLDNI